MGRYDIERLIRRVLEEARTMPSAAPEKFEKSRRKMSGKHIKKSVAALLLFSAFFGVSLGNRVVEPQGP